MFSMMKVFFTLAMILSSTIGFAEESFDLQKAWVGTSLSKESNNWVTRASKIAEHPSRFSLDYKPLNAEWVKQGNVELQVLLVQLRTLASSDLVDLFSGEHKWDSSSLIQASDKLVVKAIKDFREVDYKRKTIPEGSKLFSQKASPYSFYFVSTEAKEIFENFVNLSVTSSPENLANLVYKIQLVDSFRSRQNVQEVWSFYDENSWRLFKRAQAGLVVGKQLLSFEKQGDAFSYLYNAAFKAHENSEIREPAGE